MAATPRYKIFTPENEYIASCKYPEDAAVLIANLGNGSQIRDGHTKVVWNEGAEEQSAAESYDFVAITVRSRS